MKRERERKRGEREGGLKRDEKKEFRRMQICNHCNFFADLMFLELISPVTIFKYFFDFRNGFGMK